MPELYIITGSNGSGKSTIGHYYLPSHIKEGYTVFDGDKLFAQKRKELYPAQTPSIKEAGRLAGEWLQQHFTNSVDKALTTNDHFVYEGHFVDEETWSIPKTFLQNGYSISLLFFGLTSIESSALRVFERAVNGGHDVPPYEIERNFYGNLIALNKHYEMLDDLKIVDTSFASHEVLAELKKGTLIWSLSIDLLPIWFLKGLPRIANLIK